MVLLVAGGAEANRSSTSDVEADGAGVADVNAPNAAALLLLLLLPTTSAGASDTSNKSANGAAGGAATVSTRCSVATSACVYKHTKPYSQKNHT